MNFNDERLSEIRQDPGFRVPEGYFDDFAKRAADSLPHRVLPQAPEPTRWQRVRPFVYLAAMFAGIWCMMQIFTGFGVKQQGLYNSEIVAGFQIDTNIDDFMMLGNVSEYDILIYEDSVAAQSAQAGLPAQ